MTSLRMFWRSSSHEHIETLVAVVGPTASGKTSTAIRFCELFDGEIVGVDASQIYRGFDIGTGKANADELNGIPHHNLSFLRPDEDFDAAAFFEEPKDLSKKFVRVESFLFCVAGQVCIFRRCVRVFVVRRKYPHRFAKNYWRKLTRKDLSEIFGS